MFSIGVYTTMIHKILGQTSGSKDTCWSHSFLVEPFGDIEAQHLLKI